MSEHGDKDQKPTPFGQILFDDMFLLMLLGLIVPFLIYTVWGLMDIGGIPTLPPTEFETTAVAGGGTTTVQIDAAELALTTGCLGCHSIDGSTSIGPSWLGIYGTSKTLSDGTSVNVDDDYLHESIVSPSAKLVEGYQALMPAYGEQLSEDEIAALVEYIKGL